MKLMKRIFLIADFMKDVIKAYIHLFLWLGVTHYILTYMNYDSGEFLFYSGVAFGVLWIFTSPRIKKALLKEEKEE